MDKTHFIAIDLSSSDDIRGAAVEANEWAGGCADILVNNGEFRCRATTYDWGLWLGSCAKLRHRRVWPRGARRRPEERMSVRFVALYSCELTRRRYLERTLA